MYQWESRLSTSLLVSSSHKLCTSNCFIPIKIAQHFSPPYQVQAHMQCHKLEKEGLNNFLWNCVTQHIFIIRFRTKKRLGKYGLVISCPLEPSAHAKGPDWAQEDYHPPWTDLQRELPLKSSFRRRNGLKVRKHGAPISLYMRGHF